MLTHATSTFAQRLKQACDDSKIIPEYGKGRQVAIANRLGVTQEAVRKWFVGEAVPRPNKMRELAEYLEIDEPWLALGIKPELDRHEKRRNLITLNGAVHLVAGMIMLEGGMVAFPRNDDPRGGYVDLYAIMRGAQMAVHVSHARLISEGRYEVQIPREFEDVKCIGLMNGTPGKFNFLNLTRPIIEAHKIRKSGDYVLSINVVEGKFYCGANQVTKFKTFGELHD